MNKTPHKRKLRWHMVKHLNGTYSVQNNNAPYWQKIGRWINIGWSWKKKGKEWIQCALGIWLIAFNQTHCSCSTKEEGNLLNYLHSTLMNGSKLFGSCLVIVCLCFQLKAALLSLSLQCDWGSYSHLFIIFLSDKSAHFARGERSNSHSSFIH